jgi:3-hydroxyisobutyrate dehydrogenase-like beta-hydroxyacid dehydrogenase
LSNLCEICSGIFSVCPPDAAETVADQVLSHGFTGLYVDMNAISPQRVTRIGEALAAHGAKFVDGAIIGGPALKPNSTWLYLAGEDAQSVSDWFSAGPLETNVIGNSIGKASALKMCFAAYSKGTTALLCAVLAASEALDVRKELEQQWSRDESGFAKEALERVTRVTAKAWRFAGEMDEIAATFRAAGLPGEFHAAAADVYRRMADFKDAPTLPTLEQVLAALVQDSRKTETKHA